MKQGLLKKAMVIGACIGGGVALFNPQVRTEMYTYMVNAKRKTNYWVKHPAETAMTCQAKLDTLTQSTIQALELTINTVAQFEVLIHEIERKLAG
ncbi:hypothetical protein [Amphibacillus sediminis]|uniref:hypothetical protein n=1 Tax=Amphibacillus sediminis TaxID=360185 RepID=UPI00083460D1|nr:hypothetical protein [Amphibacillus sediminis]